ncbi:hypothetical protein [Flavobacterium succinicans]|uniref:Uncharacterized protein n=1 Tax=Flavobacterium succinicans TaxID=29536 RepID=A0A199XT56_9FLAO|nr:hypothetical protein [Flavobacterium succinicans]OAZ04514.1 hypothetical protein FLB_10880 [Flavobacterium succinicans]
MYFKLTGRYLIVFLVYIPLSYGQVGIGSMTPNKSAMLDIVSSDKGMLIPRVALKSGTDGTTISNGNVDGLLVYNTALVADVKPGFYYWENKTWNRILIEEKKFTGEVGNGLNNDNGKLQLGGSLEKPTTLKLSATNTLALIGLEEGNTKQDDVLVVDANGVLKKVPNSLVKEKQEIVLAKEGQTEFIAPLPTFDADKINVYRNGIRIGFTISKPSVIKLESGIICDFNDEIRIVQFY